ncbi:MAG: DNA/RNA non-specific endonuclease [Bacteroidia bacterium]|nr:DNA/RNA non-specific endonuclease [Bacteroidia bacterium]
MSTDIGYSELFLEKNLPLPEVDSKICAPLKKGAGHEIKYIHYSSIQHKDRKLPIFTAVNIKGEDYNAKPREGNEPWAPSDQIEEGYQLLAHFYSKDENTFDRGHLVRRVDPCWGNAEIADKAEIDTFKWTNCTPQHKKLNQKGGIWFELEQHVMEHGVKNKIANVSVFSGPVLDKNDKYFKVKYNEQGIKIPITYWKVIAWKKSDGKIHAVGFLMSQWEWIKDKLIIEEHFVKEQAKPKLEDDYFENLKFSDHKTYQVPIKEIEKVTGIKFNWPDVVFPYAKQAFTEIRGTKLNKSYSVAAFHHHFNAIENKGLKSKREESFKLLNENAAGTEELLSEIKKTGKSGLTKQYNLNNVTL